MFSVSVLAWIIPWFFRETPSYGGLSEDKDSPYLEFTARRPLLWCGQEKRSNNTFPFWEGTARLNMQQAMTKKPQKKIR